MKSVRLALAELLNFHKLGYLLSDLVTVSASLQPWRAKLQQPYVIVIVPLPGYVPLGGVRSGADAELLDTQNDVPLSGCNAPTQPRYGGHH
jgi:hypothetical protein